MRQRRVFEIVRRYRVRSFATALSIGLMVAVSLLVSILLGIFKIIVGVFTDTADDRADEVTIVPEGSYYNYRKDRFDDGLDPYGRYDDIDHPDGDWW